MSYRISLPVLLLLSLLSLLSLSSLSSAAKVTNPSRVPAKAVLLSKIKSLTLRSDKMTSARRVSPVHQLTCTGPAYVCKLYNVDTMRCVNSGYDYSEDDVQWTCTASLPEEVKLGSTDVSCEGYESSEDPYVLKGSCGVEYRLLLTEKGREKLGQDKDLDHVPKSAFEKLIESIFWFIFIGVIITIALAALGCFQPGGLLHRAGGAGGRGPGGGGGGPGRRNGFFGSGGGTNDYHDDNNDPPPPYDYQPPPPRKSTSSRTTTRPSSRTTTTTNPAANPAEQWRPGFWSGALGGAAAGYFAGNRQQRRQQQDQPGGAGGFWGNNNGGRRGGGGWFGGGGGAPTAGGGSPGWSSGSSSSSSADFGSSSRYESTGFGGTSRR